MKHTRTAFVLILIVVLLVVAKLIFFKKEEGQKGNNQGKDKNTPLLVTATILKAEKIEQQLFAPGSLLANEEVELHPEISGKIIMLSINEGNAVPKGDLLVKINDAEEQAQLKKYQMQEKLAGEKEGRLKKLLSLNGVSQEEYDIAMNQLDDLKADIEFTRAQIAKTEIRAPFSGLIGLRSVSEGSYVSPSTRIAVISQVDPIKIDFTIPERYAPLLRKNNTVHFSVEGTNEITEAKIIAIEPRVDLSSRTIQVRALCANKTGKLMPGAFAKVSLVLDQPVNGLMIPTEALVPILKGQKVFIKKNGKAEEVKVSIGLRTDNQVEVMQGLHEGDTLITSGMMQLKNEMPVLIKEIK